MAKLVRIKVAKELLVQALQLPTETTIINTIDSEADDAVQLVLEHPNLPDLKADEPIPLTKPIYHKITTEFDWNL